MCDIYLPEELKQLLGNQPYVVDDIGKSGSKVLIFSDKVLKIQPHTNEVRSELEMMLWLDGKIPAPKCLFHCTDNDVSYLLMSRIPGKMSCDDEYMQSPAQLAAILAEALHRLWAVDTSDCPVSFTLSHKLALAKERVDSGTVDTDDAEPETYGEKGFANPAELLEWLVANQPEENLVLSHGDFCLPNIFIENNALSGFIDIGSMGIADKWQDIALCYRSVKNNFGGRYGGKIYPDFDPNTLFDALHIEPDWNKIRYYILLDELF